MARDSVPRALDWISCCELLVLDLVVALEGEPVDDRRFHDGDDEPAARLGDADVLEQAGRVKRLQARNRSWRRRDVRRDASLEIRADGVGFDAAIALDDDRQTRRRRLRPARQKPRQTATPNNTTPRSKPATTSPRLTRTHMSMRKAPLLPLVAAPAGGLLAVSLSSSQLRDQSSFR